MTEKFDIADQLQERLNVYKETAQEDGDAATVLALRGLDSVIIAAFKALGINYKDGEFDPGFKTNGQTFIDAAEKLVTALRT